MYKKFVIGLSTACCAALLCVGCASALQETQTAPAAEPAAPAAPALQAVGTPEDGAYEIELTNALSDGITDMAITKTGQESDDAANATNITCSIAAAETVKLYFKAPADATADATYTLTVSTKQGKTTKFELAPLGDMKDAKLMMDGELNYLTYTDKSGASKSTKDAVEAAAAAKKAAEEAAAAEAAAAEQAAADQAAADAAAAEQAAAAQYSEEVSAGSDYGYTSTYSDYSNNSYEESSSSSYEDTGSSSGSSQSEDSCVAGGVALR